MDLIIIIIWMKEIYSGSHSKNLSESCQISEAYNLSMSLYSKFINSF